MRLGVVILPELRRPELESVWARAEALGFDHAWTYDHLAWRSLRDSTWYAAVPTLAAAALVTRRMRLGTLVASPNFRHPVPFARELIALDELSGGRFTLGIGSGGMGYDATILGQAAWTPRERSERFAEFVALTDQLLREPKTSWRGRYYAADEARSIPGCVQRPRLPFAIAADGSRALRVAAQHGACWVTTGARTAERVPAREGAEGVRRQRARLLSACEEVGRDPATLACLVLTGPSLDPGLDSVDTFRDTLRRYEDVGVTDLVVHWPRAAAPYARDLVQFERVIGAVRG